MTVPNRKVLGLAAALAALATPAVVAAAETSEPSPDQASPDGAGDAPTVTVAVGDDFMAFTVHQDIDRVVVADHASHASHASHSSHSSHYSSR